MSVYLPAVDQMVEYTSGLLGEQYLVMFFYSETHHFCRNTRDVGCMETAHDGFIWNVAWHPLGHVLCSASNDHTW